MATNDIPTVECQMMVRKPVSQVFQAFIDPAITTKFWFTKSSGPLEKDRTITWEWEMYNVSCEVEVKDLIPDKKISILEWDKPAKTGGYKITDFEFEPLSDATTYVVIKMYGFQESGMDLIQAIKDNTGGYTTVLDGLKAWLEFGIELNLVRDKFSKGTNDG